MPRKRKEKDNKNLKYKRYNRKRNASNSCHSFDSNKVQDTCSTKIDQIESNNQSQSSLYNSSTIQGKCCVGDLCKFTSQSFLPNQHCALCGGNVHYFCAIFNSSGTNCTCKRCYQNSIQQDKSDIDIIVNKDFNRKDDRMKKSFGSCCIGDMCKYTSQVFLTDQNCARCGGNVHYNCAVFNSSGTECTCKKCSLASMPNSDNKKTTLTVPKLCDTISRSSILNKALEVLNQTQTTGNKHKACVCVICDSFIIGTEKIHWLSEKALNAKEAYLSVRYVERMLGKMIPHTLRIQYQVEDNENLSDLVLSPRAHKKQELYMSCGACYRNIMNPDVEKPPRFGLTNGWIIGEIPNSIIEGEIEDILAASIAKVRAFGNVYSYSAGAHQTIKGHHVFFVHDPEYVSKSFNSMLQSGVDPNMYVMICGRVTPAQRDIIRRRCTINADRYLSLFNWLILNHPSYSGMNPPKTCPQPTFIAGFRESINNTDISDGTDTVVEHTFDEEMMTFSARRDPTENTGPFKSEKELILSYLKGKKPTLLFRSGDYMSGHEVKLIDLFPLNFPYGWGGPDEYRATKVSKSEVLRHYCRIALPQMHQSQFLLVVCSMWQKMESFKKCIISCKTNFNSSTFADSLSKLTQDQIETAAKKILDGEKTENETLQKLFKSIKGHTASLGHSNEAASYARQRLFSLWHYFGAPAVFFTVTPCDECSFRVRLYATCEEHHLPAITDIFDESNCVIDFNARKKWRSKYPGACVTEYESMMQIVIGILIGWDQKSRSGTSGIFGIPEAYADCCEEQARYTLHSHISVWIKDFNQVRNLLYHDDEKIRVQAKEEIELYFKTIAQASLGDLYELRTNSRKESQNCVKVNDYLVPPEDQHIRNMRHHVHCKELHGVIGYYSYQDNLDDSSDIDGKRDTKKIVKNNCIAHLGNDIISIEKDKHQLDMLAYTYTYHMMESNRMKPPDCCPDHIVDSNLLTLESKIKEFNVRNPLLQLRFNIHDCYHRPSCFKKGPECRTELPQRHKLVACIQFDEENSIDWYFIDGTRKKVAPFKYIPQRNIGDQFMNVNNDIATTILACNNNVTIGDKACFFYVTLYQSKHNQKEESFSYHSICSALSKRIKFRQEQLQDSPQDHDESTDGDSSDFGEGLSRMLSSLFGHTASNVLSAPMAKKLLSVGSRFRYSHDFMSISLIHLLQWMKDESDLEFKLRTVKNNDDEYEHVVDLFINNVIYRPVELENLSCYELIAYYEMKKMTKKKIESGNFNVEGKNMFNLMEEHPSSKYMVMSKRKHTCIPCISSINLLPNVAELEMEKETCNEHTMKLRENYAQIILLLFYPFRIQSDLELDGSYWKRYKDVLAKEKISEKCLDVIQNIQDVCYNCSKLRTARDDLEQATVYLSHEDDEKRKTNIEDSNCTSIDEVAELFQNAENFGIREVDSSKRKLSVIGNRYDIVHQQLPSSDIQNKDITEIPDDIIIPGLAKEKRKVDTKSDNRNEENISIARDNTNINCAMVIDILSDTVLNNLPANSIHDSFQQNNSDQCTSFLSFESIISHFTLDFKQSVAFEVMSSSFILQSLITNKVSNESIKLLFKEDNVQEGKYIKSLAELKASMKSKGGEDHLLMFLSGMGGTGKSEVIKAFVYHSKQISRFFGWGFDEDTVKITAMTGVAACQIPNGRTLHSQACLTGKKIGQALVNSWKSTKLLVIDEVSFLDENNLVKLDKHMRLLKQSDFIFGGCHIVFVGDFFQLLPVKGKPLFKCNTVQFHAINKAVFLNISHRFDKDPTFGEIMRKFRIGKVTKEDIQKINTRYYSNDNVSLPPITQLRCACFMNAERNAYNNVLFLEHLKATHPKADENSTNCPTHTCIIKATIRSKEKGDKISNVMYNRLLDECGDCDVINSKGSYVDLALKFFHNIPLMMNTNERIEEMLANGTPCRGVYVKLKRGCHFVQENWEGYMVNTISVDHVKHIVCKLESKVSHNDRYFLVKPESKLCSVRLREWNNMMLEQMQISYIPINSSLSTTGHKLQGKTLDNLVVNSWAYGCPHWVYVVLSRVKTLNGLILNQMLDEERSYEANRELVRWEENMKKKIELKTFRDRGNDDLKKYLDEEEKYNSLSLTTDSQNSDDHRKSCIHKVMKQNSLSQDIENETHQSSTEVKNNVNRAKSATESHNCFDVIMKRTSITQYSERCTKRKRTGGKITQKKIKKEKKSEAKKDKEVKCPSMERRNHSKKKKSLFSNAIHGVSYLLNINASYFKFVDVPGDGDCFFHSVLKNKSFAVRFTSVQQLRTYLSYTVHVLYNQDPFLQALFAFERIDVNRWCANISCMNRWAEITDMIIFTYVLQNSVVVVSNNLHGFNIEDTKTNLNYIMRLHYSRMIRANEFTHAQNFMSQTVDMEQNFSRNDVIYLFHHSCGYPLARVARPNHFGYLEPIQKPNITIGLNSIREIFCDGIETL